MVIFSSCAGYKRGDTQKGRGKVTYLRMHVVKCCVMLHPWQTCAPGGQGDATEGSHALLINMLSLAIRLRVVARLPGLNKMFKNRLLRKIDQLWWRIPFDCGVGEKIQSIAGQKVIGGLAGEEAGGRLVEDLFLAKTAQADMTEKSNRPVYGCELRNRLDKYWLTELRG